MWNKQPSTLHQSHVHSQQQSARASLCRCITNNTAVHPHPLPLLRLHTSQTAPSWLTAAAVCYTGTQ